MEIHYGYIPSTIGAIAALHAHYYSKYWNFGLYFEAKVATELSEFLLRFEPERDGIWLLTGDGKIHGSIAIDGIKASEGAHLRWFIVEEGLWGKGHGKALLQAAMGFCKEKGYKNVYLWTFEGLHRARRLYDSFGFRLVQEQIGLQWGKEVREQRLVWESS